MYLTKYSNILGKPNEGFHSKRFLGFAAYDIVGTVVIAFIISQYYKLSFMLTLLILFIIAELLHLLFGVKTYFITEILNINQN